jgi:hypothetical protein
MSVAAQQHAKIIEPRDDALQFYAIHQENGEWNFVFADVIEKGVLKVLCAVGWHGLIPFFAPRAPAPRSFLGPFTSVFVSAFDPAEPAKLAAGATIRRRGGQRCKPKFKAALKTYPASA